MSTSITFLLALLSILKFDRNEAVRLSRLALSLDENDEVALCTAGWVTAFFVGDYETVIDFVDRAVASNPNDFACGA